ncbi:MAG: serine/threonine protein kinase [Myxococcales bacterium]|nr:serine/threonine protein kinase [Myxococcales bacterium]
MTSPSSITELRPLARGGMAELHVGRMTGLAGVEKLVVVKRILPTLAHRTDFVDMFVSEARVAMLLQHPNIVQTYDVGEDEEGFYLVMEYLEGADLRRVLSQLQHDRRSIPKELAIQVMIGVLAGLHYAHTKSDADGKPLGVVHRDVSPHNTFVTWDGSVKLLDFGVALASTNLAEEDEDLVQGKLRYMSPEQCLNAPVDPRSDVYAAGVMLYELLTGRRAHLGDDRTQIQAAILDQPVPPPSAHGIILDDDLLRIVMRPLEKKRAARFQSARDFQEALEDYCQAQGIFLSPIRLGEWLRDLLPTPQGPTPNRTASITRAPRPGASFRSTPHAELRSLGGFTVVHFRGRLNEAFDGRTVGEQIDGPTIFDLEGIERITSFGIRSWLEMMRVSRARPLYLARVPQAFVNQVSMVRGLLGKASVCSFYAPFLCPDDHTEIRALLAGEDARRMLALGDVPHVPCPLGTAHRPTLDEDLELYDVLSDAFVAEPPAQVRAGIEALDADRDQPPIEKILDDHRTTIHIRRSLDESLRWKRLLDGLEGEVAFDLTEVTRTTDEGVEGLASALASVAPDLSRVTVRAAPRAVWDALATLPVLEGRLELASLVIPVSCPSPACEEHGLVRQVEVMAPPSPAEPFQLDACRTCLGSLAPHGDALVDVPGFTPPPAPPARKREVAQRRGCLAALFGALFG